MNSRIDKIALALEKWLFKFADMIEGEKSQAPAIYKSFRLSRQKESFSTVYGFVCIAVLLIVGAVGHICFDFDLNNPTHSNIFILTGAAILYPIALLLRKAYSSKQKGHNNRKHGIRE